MKLSIVFPFMNQHELTRTAVEWAIANLSGDYEVEIILLDNVSDVEFPYYKNKDGKDLIVPIKAPLTAGGQPHTPDAPPPTKTAIVRYLRLSKPIGVYPVFWQALKYCIGDIVAFFHSDLIISEKGWDAGVIKSFDEIPRLGLMGFIGSNEIDSSGGRGLGTISNFAGAKYHSRNEKGEEFNWQGSPAGVHGKHETGLTKAAVVDGCAMIFRRSMLEQIPFRQDFPIHHFYDRLLSCEVREMGYMVSVLGIECDHISGQTVNQEPKYSQIAEAWAREHGLDIGDLHNWDSVLYREAERQWLLEYRDTKNLVPCRV